MQGGGGGGVSRWHGYRISVVGRIPPGCCSSSSVGSVYVVVVLVRSFVAQRASAVQVVLLWQPRYPKPIWSFACSDIKLTWLALNHNEFAFVAELPLHPFRLNPTFIPSERQSTASTGGYAEYAALELLGNVYEIPKHFHRIIRKLSALSILNVSSCYFMCWKMRVIHSAMSGRNVSECIVVIETCTGRFRGRIIY